MRRGDLPLAGARASTDRGLIPRPPLALAGGTAAADERVAPRRSRLSAFRTPATVDLSLRHRASSAASLRFGRRHWCCERAPPKATLTILIRVPALTGKQKLAIPLRRSGVAGVADVHKFGLIDRSSRELSLPQSNSTSCLSVMKAVANRTGDVPSALWMGALQISLRGSQSGSACRPTEARAHPCI